MKESIKNEALRRMKALKLYDEGYDSPVAEFRLKGKVWKSERFGILYYLNEEEKQVVKEFEKKYSRFGAKVYHCYRAEREFGDILYLLYVIDDESDSAKEFDSLLRRGVIYLYAHNFSEPAFSEHGTAYIKSQYGGIVIR
ncbi:MAG: hypothetical protein IJZ77_02980 [Bacilli bacterium]|nr:hypothetical protein [Bacilli bacterium]